MIEINLINKTHVKDKKNASEVSSVFPLLKKNLQSHGQNYAELLEMIEQVNVGGIEIGKNLRVVDPEDKEEYESAINENYRLIEKTINKILPEEYTIKEKYRPDSKLWRGTNPYYVCGLLSGGKNKLIVESEYPNVAHKWETSLGHGVDKRESSKLPFVIAIGFDKPTEWQIKKTQISPVFKDSIDTVDGKVGFDNVREIAVRLKGVKSGQVMPPKFYQIERKAA